MKTTESVRESIGAQLARLPWSASLIILGMGNDVHTASLSFLTCPLTLYGAP